MIYPLNVSFKSSGGSGVV